VLPPDVDEVDRLPMLYLDTTLESILGKLLLESWKAIS